MDGSFSPLEVSAILVFTKTGKKIIGKYYKESEDLKHKKAELEQQLHSKASKLGSTHDPDVLLYDEFTVIFKQFDDVRVFVLLSNEENELVGLEVFNALTSCLQSMFEDGISHYTLTNNFDLLVLLLDEMIDDGMIFETDPETLLSRVSLKDHSGIPNDTTLVNAMKSVGGSLLRSFRG